MGQTSSTTCDGGDSVLANTIDEDEEMLHRVSETPTSNRKSSKKPNTSTAPVPSAEPPKSITKTEPVEEWLNDALWRETLIAAAYGPSKRKSNIQIKLFGKEEYQLSAQMVARMICPFLDIRSVLYLMEGSNHEIYEALKNNITHFYYVPLLTEEDSDDDLDGSFFPEDFSKPKKKKEKSTAKIVFPPKHANSWYWEPILSQFPSLVVVLIPQLYIYNHFFDLKGELSHLKSLQNVNNRALERRYMKRSFPQYRNIILTEEDVDLFDENLPVDLPDSYRQVENLTISCVKFVNNQQTNRVLRYFCNLKSLSIQTCKFSNSPSPAENKNSLVVDPSCVIDFEGLETSKLEELSILCVQSMYNINSILKKHQQGSCPKIVKFKYSSPSTVLGAEKLEKIAAENRKMKEL